MDVISEIQLNLSEVIILVFAFACLIYLFKPTDAVNSYSVFYGTSLILYNVNRCLDFLLEKVLETNGKTYRIHLFLNGTWNFTHDPKNIEYILKGNFDNFIKGPEFYGRFGPLLGNGIFSADGEMWEMHRKTAAKMFTVNKFKGHILSSIHKHLDYVEKKLCSVGEGGAIDIHDLFYRFTLDTIGDIAYGEDIDSLSHDVPFAKAFDYCQVAMNFAFFNPFWRLERYLTPSGWKFWSCIRTLNAFAYGVVKKRREEVSEYMRLHKDDDDDVTTVKTKTNEDSKRCDLLSIFLSRNPDIKDDYLRDVVMNFIIAGRDTTAQALSWSIYELCLHPEIQDQCYREISSKSGSCNLSYDDVNDLEFVRATFLEVLRLHPSVPKEAKYCVKDDELPDGSIVKAGELICFCPWVMGRLPWLWDNALTFNPGRYLAPNPKCSPYLFTAFQAGPRMCLGQNMAILEATCTLGRLLSKYRFEMVPGQNVVYLNSLTLPMKNGLLVKIFKR